MSLYNQLFGTNSLAGAVIIALDADIGKIGRFRDAYVTPEGKFAILTRTGGGNRPDYTEQNAYLLTLPGFIEEKDLTTDPTYAVFVYEVPEFIKEKVTDSREG